MTEREALKLALEALKELVEKFDSEQFTSICELDPAKDAIAAAEEALAQPEQCRKEQRGNGEYVCNCNPGECPELAQPEQEPVGEVSKAEFGDYPVICWRKGYVAKIGDKFYTAPPQRTWEGLSVFEINDLVENTEYEDYRDLVERTEAKLKEKNT